MLNSLLYILKLKKSIRPKTYYDDLAEMGVLEEYLTTMLKERYENDPEFRKEMYETLFRYSSEVSADLEVYYLEKMCENLSYFLEYTKQWRNQKP